MKAATGEIITAEELGGAEVHTKRSGVSDYMADSEEHAFAIGRTLVKNVRNRTLLHQSAEAPRVRAAVPRLVWDARYMATRTRVSECRGCIGSQCTLPWSSTAASQRTPRSR